MPRTWDDGTRCDECCNGDRCDDPTHHDRNHCPYCKGTGWALWSDVGRSDYIAYLTNRQGLTAEQAEAVLTKYGYGVAVPDK